MSDLKIQLSPMARTEDILIESLDDEVLIYDLRSHEATCLNASAALIWDLCDRQRSIGDIVDELDNAEVTEFHVAAVIDQLRGKSLLEDDAAPGGHEVGAPRSRRAFLGTAAAASMVLPAVMSTVVPAAAQLQPIGTLCGSGDPGTSSGNAGDPFCNGGPGSTGDLKCCPYNTAPAAKCCVLTDNCGSALPPRPDNCF